MIEKGNVDIQQDSKGNIIKTTTKFHCRSDNSVQATLLYNILITLQDIQFELKSLREHYDANTIN